MTSFANKVHLIDIEIDLNISERSVKLPYHSGMGGMSWFS